MPGYARVIPRDLFNEASLLKCYGRLWICLDETPDHRAELVHDGRAFIVWQCEGDGSISILNVKLLLGGKVVNLARPLNSREPWPLWAEAEWCGVDDIRVFDDDGNLSADMLALIRNPQKEKPECQSQ